MNKEELLRELSDKVTSGEITNQEISNYLHVTPVVEQVVSGEPASVSKPKGHFSVTKLLYTLGGIIAVVGMVLFAYQVWEDLGSLGRIAITLGLGFLVTAIGSFLSRHDPEDNTQKDTIGTVFHFMGGMLIPGGAVVALHEFNITLADSPWLFAVTFGTIFLFYLLLNYVRTNAILTFFAVANATAFIYLTVNALIPAGSTFRDYHDLYTYLTMVVGASYVLLAYSFRGGPNERLAPALYFFGFFGIQCAAFSQYFDSFGYGHSLWPAAFSLGLVFVFYLVLNFYLKKTVLTFLTIMNGTAFLYVLVGALIGDSYYLHIDVYSYLTMVIGACYLLLSHSFRGKWDHRLIWALNFFGGNGLLGAAFSRVYDSFPWQMFFPLLVLGGFAFSIYSRSRTILVLTTIYLLVYVSYITGKYFADSVGWPISLVVLGFIFIGLGYVSININRKYIKTA